MQIKLDNKVDNKINDKETQINLTSLGFCLVYKINLVSITALGNGKTLKGR